RAVAITENELKSLQLPAAEEQKIRTDLANLQARLAKVRTDLPGLTAKAQLVRVESATVNCIAQEVGGSETNLFRFPTRVILFKYPGEKGDSHEFMETGAMIKVGVA